MKIWVISNGIGCKPTLAKTKEKALEILSEMGNRFKGDVFSKKYLRHEIKDFGECIKLTFWYNRGNPTVYDAYPIDVVE